MIKNIGFIIVGIIINLIVLKYGMKLIFPRLTKMRKITNKLEVSKQSVQLVSGKCNFGSSKTEINTSNPEKPAFVWLPDSNNLKGGAQLSYTFWLNLKSNTQLQDKIIFTRGSMIQDNTIDPPTYISKCPMVRINSHTSRFPELEISYNTLAKIDNYIELKEEIFNMIVSTSKNPKWFLISITFQDYIDFSDSEHGIQVQVFINDHLVKTVINKNDSLKLNYGNVIITPHTNEGEMDETSSDQESFYSDITYHNYALDILDIQNLYYQGMSNTAGCITARDTAAENISTAYQQLSLHNNLNQI
jgi:hypothetical protein|tara:strand:- start:19677 stop:20585 length:909 start_codon:yes stop_codon:yes gene_type:complete